MRTSFYSLLVIFFVSLHTLESHAQATELKNLRDLPSTFSTTEVLPKPVGEDDKLFDNRVMHSFFTSRVANYMSSSSDINFSKGYALLDNEDGRLFIGGTWNFRENKVAKTRYLLTSGIKSNVKEQFASLYEGGKLQNDIGVSLKFTIVGKGVISVNTSDQGTFDKVRSNRELMIADYSRKIEEEIAAYSASLDKAFAQRNIQDADAQKIHQDAYNEMLTKFAQTKYKKFEEEIAKSEADAVYENDLFTWSWDHWLGFEFYAPLTASEYNITDSLRLFKFREENYRPIAASLTYTNIIESSKWGKFQLMVGAGIEQNNSVKSEEIEKYSYDQYLAQSIRDTLPGTNFPDTLLMASLKKDDVYVGKFDQWFGPQLKGKFVFMPCDWIGVSVGGELNFRNGDKDYMNENMNWTVGIPVSLNDEDGERKVNFELQWREVAQKHSVGFSLNYIFGKPEF